MALVNDQQIKEFAQKIGGDQYTINTKFGINPSCGTTTEDIWFNGGTLQFLTSAETLDVVSTSANDTLAGTGARTILIDGLDSNFNRIIETINLSGLTPVTTTNSFIRVNRSYVTNIGSIGYNEGDITLTASTAATIQAALGATFGQTEKTQYTVPNKCKIALVSWNGSCKKNDDFELYLQTREFGESWRIRDNAFLYQSAFEHTHFGETILGPKSDIRVIAKTSTGTKSITSEYSYVLFTDM